MATITYKNGNTLQIGEETLQKIESRIKEGIDILTVFINEEDVILIDTSKIRDIG